MEKGSSSNWMSVIKEALEMSNGLGQDLSRRTPMVYQEPHAETRGMEHVKGHFGSGDHKWPNGHEKSKTGEMNGNQESSVNVLSDGTKVSPVGSNQEVSLMEVNSLTDVSSMDDQVLKRVTSRTLKRHNILDISSVEPHVSTEQKEVSGLLESHPVMERQSESLVKHTSMIPSASSDISGNREGTLSSAAPLLRQAHKEHANAYEDVGSRSSVDSQTKLCGFNNATLPNDFHASCQNVKFQVTQRLNFEHSPNVHTAVDPKGQHERIGSGMKNNLSNTENQEAGVPHKGLVIKGETQCSTITERASKGGSQHFLSNSFNSASAEPSSVCSSTSVSKLKNLVHNLCHVASPTPTLKSTEPFQLGTDNTNEPAVECEASNLPPRQDGSFRMTSNAECTPAKEATSTRRPVCSAVGSPQEEVKKQIMPNKRETASFSHSEEIANVCSLQPSHSIAQEHTLFQDSASQITEDPPQMSNILERSPRKTIVHSNTHEFPQPDSHKNGHGQSQKITCKSTESSDYSSKTTLESLSLKKEGNAEYEGVCPATEVPRKCTRKKTRKTKKRKLVPDKENGQMLNTSCDQSVKSCGSPQASHLPEEQLLGAVKSRTTAQKCSAIALTEKEEKDEEQSGIKHQISTENAVHVSKDPVPESLQSESHKKRNRPSAVSQDRLSSVPMSDAQGSVKAKSYAKKAKSKTSSHVTSNVEEKPPPCDISKSLDLSFSPCCSDSSSDKSLSSQNTIKTFQNRKNSKNTMPPSSSTPKCSVVSNTGISSSDFLFEKVQSTPDVQNPRSRYSYKDAKSINATSQAKSEVQMNVCSVSNTLKKARNLKKLKKTPVQRPQASTIVQSNLHRSDVPQGIVKTPDLEDLSILKTAKEQRFGLKGKEVNQKVKKPHSEITANSRIDDACLSPENTFTSSELQNTFQPVSDVKTEPEKAKDYLKKLKHQEGSTSKTQSYQSVKLEPDTFPHGEFPVSGCGNVPLKDQSPKLVKVEIQKMDCLKSIKACVIRRKRTGRSFRKGKQQKLTKLLSVVQETSENMTAQDPQEISQNYRPIDLVREEVKAEEQTEVSVDSSGKPLCTKQNDGSMPTHSSIGTVSSDLCPEHEQTILTRSVATVDSVESRHFTSNAFDGGRKRLFGKPPKKHRQSKRSGASAAQTAERRTSKPQGLRTHTKKKGKMSKLQLRNLYVLSVRHSRRLSRFTLGSVRRLQKCGHTAAVDPNSLIPRKPRKHKKKKRGTKKSNTPLPKSSCGLMNSCQSVPHTLRSPHLKTSKKKVSPKRRKLDHKVIICDQALVADPEPMKNCSSTVMMSSHAEILEEKCDQIRHSLKQTPKKLKTKRKMSEPDTRQASKRTALRQQEPSETGKFLDCFEGPLKTDSPNEQRSLSDVKISSAEHYCADKRKTLPRTAVEEVHFALYTNVSPESKDRDVKGRECEARWGKKERKSAFELALEAFLNTTEFYSSDAICDKKRKQESLEKAVRTGVEAGKENSSSRLKVASEDAPLQNFASEKVNAFTQDCNADCIATLNKGPCIVEADVKNKRVESLSKESAKKCIVCKYCGQYFRHISAYAIHQRIHTGEKPYRCKVCGKNFAQLSNLKSHRKIHTQTVTLCCPCCSKKFSHKNCLLAHFKIHIQELHQGHRKRSSTSLEVQSDSSLVCKTCEENFPNSCRLKVHKREGPLSCRTCGRQFEKSSRLLIHERTHWPVKPYACAVCAKGFNGLKALKKHSREHAGETPFSCSNCAHAFRDLAELRVHQVTKQCSIKGELDGDNNGDIEGFLVSQGVDGQVNTPVFFKCRICRQLYRKWCQYTLHLQTHTKLPPYLCFACGQSYEKDSEVSVHCRVCCQSSGEETACGASLFQIFHNKAQSYASTFRRNSYHSCSGSLLPTSESKSWPVTDAGKPKENSQTPGNPSQRTGHLTLQTSEVMEASPLQDVGPPSPTPSVITCVSSDDSLECTEISPSLWRFQCSRCGRRFKQYRSLRAHVQSHAPGFRHVCGHCGQTFERWNRLWLHQRIHCGKGRCYSCSQCSLQFRFFGSYKDHMLNHAGERPLACPLCPETFVHEEGLHAHQCEVHKPSRVLQCEVCAKTFSNLRNLLKHSRLHNGAVSHQCLSCERSFTNNKIFLEHLKTHSTSLGLPLPDIPSEPLAFPHKCKRCTASFSTGDLLYAHQTCHFRRQVSPACINEPTLSMSRGKAHTLPSTTRPLISTLNLDAVPNDKSLYSYPHPDKLYVMPSLSRIRPPITMNLGSDDENPLPASGPCALPNISTPVSGHPSQRRPESTQTSSETDIPHLPQGLQGPEPTSVRSLPDDRMPTCCAITSKAEDNSIPNSVTQAVHFVETTVFLDGPSTFAKSELYGDLDESFECQECFYKTSSILRLHEHYFLRALGNRCPTPQMEKNISDVRD
ncbi:uncharacterized protein [Salminus brasiliensis]